eukprot:6499888-Prymnesium_polylepis.1
MPLMSTVASARFELGRAHGVATDADGSVHAERGFRLEWRLDELSLRLFQVTAANGTDGARLNRSASQRVVWETSRGEAFVALGLGSFSASNYWNSFTVNDDAARVTAWQSLTQIHAHDAERAPARVGDAARTRGIAVTAAGQLWMAQEEGGTAHNYSLTFREVDDGHNGTAAGPSHRQVLRAARRDARRDARRGTLRCGRRAPLTLAYVALTAGCAHAACGPLPPLPSACPRP